MSSCSMNISYRIMMYYYILKSRRCVNISCPGDCDMGVTEVIYPDILQFNEQRRRKILAMNFDTMNLIDCIVYCNLLLQ